MANIEIGLPVSGDLNEPQFSYGPPDPGRHWAA